MVDSAGEFAEVVPGRAFEFPRDHGEHPEFKTEWWYFTGHLACAESGREFGYQFTIFQSGLSGEQRSASPSAWAADQRGMGHFALSDLKTERFMSFERYSRRALGLAGVEGTRIWLEDWSAERAGGAEFGTWRVRAQGQQEGIGPVAVDLELVEVKPPVLQGQEGYSQKGPEPQHASYYVALTRLATSGEVGLGAERFSVSGSSWYDHEWSSEAMASGIVGWDWFSLQLDDQRELMLYLLRREDGTIEPASSGSWIEADGSKTHLSLEDFSLEVLSTRSAPSSRVYPSRWRIAVPSLGLELQVEPRLDDQEMSTGVVYWEGAVQVVGSSPQGSISGLGFVEMTGY